MKVQHTNLWLNTLLDIYPEEPQMLVLVLINSVIHNALSYLFGIHMQWLLLATSTAVYNKTKKFVAFQLMSNKTKKPNKKEFA